MKKQFDLKAVLAGEPFYHENYGECVEFHYFDKLGGGRFNLFAIFENQLDRVMYFDDFGRAGNGELKLFMTPKRITLWVNIYRNGNLYSCSKFYNSRSDAILHGIGNIATVPIEFEE